MTKKYLRDGRAPVPKDPKRSATMSSIRAKHTKPELAVRRALRDAGHAGYRLHYAKAPGRPDLAFVGKKMAVFVHGCFWHGCPHCRPSRPKTHRTFWETKLDRNQERDSRKIKALRKAGWQVATLWECKVKKDVGLQVRRVIRLLDQAGQRLPNIRLKKRFSNSQKKEN